MQRWKQIKKNYQNKIKIKKKKIKIKKKTIDQTKN